MKALIDSHTFLWFVNDDPRLSETARSLISAPGNVLYLSIASAWELAIKFSIGKLVLSQPFPDFLEEQLALNTFRLLSIDPTHLRCVVGLPFHHKDPFDRLLIAQSLTDALPLISLDTKMDAYGVNRIW